MPESTPPSNGPDSPRNSDRAWAQLEQQINDLRGQIEKFRSELLAPVPPIGSIPPRLTPCQRARAALEKALEAWVTVSGSTVKAYSGLSRSLTYRDAKEAWEVVRRTAAIVLATCGPGSVDPGMMAALGAPFAKRAILRDV